jgi:putative DNA primase/helicase
MGYLQRLAGYCLTGHVNEEVWSCFYGPGGNGKGTYWETLSKILGDTREGGYAAELPPETLIAQRYANDYSTQNDIARLCGARLALADEGDKHRRLNADLIKKLTGGGKLVGKLMHKDKFDFAPTHKLVTLCNYKPRVEVDDATMRRLHLIPLLQKFKSDVIEETSTVHLADVHLKQKLLAEASGILAWAIEGSLEWSRKGLQPPATVKHFTDDFFATADPYENWIAACGHEKDLSSFNSSKVLFSQWSEHCKAIRQYSGDLKSFCEDLEKREDIFTKARPKKNGKQERGFYGLKLTMPKSDAARLTSSPFSTTKTAVSPNGGS